MGDDRLEDVFSEWRALKGGIGKTAKQFGDEVAGQLKNCITTFQLDEAVEIGPV